MCKTPQLIKTVSNMYGIVLFLVAVSVANGNLSKQSHVIVSSLWFFHYFQGANILEALERRVDGRIVGGQETKIENFPWQVSLHVRDRHICGGAILGPKKILTASHCIHAFVGKNNRDDLRIRAGMTSLKMGGVYRKISKMVEHPRFNKPTILNNDIAVLILAEALVFGPHIQPVALPNPEEMLRTGTVGTVSGWGYVRVDGPGADVLRYVDLPVVDHASCVKSYQNYNGQARVTDQNFCAGYWKVGGKDSCQGDSGGPFVVRGGRTPVLHGVVSWGYKCALPDYPGIYARVSAFIPWINSIN